MPIESCACSLLASECLPAACPNHIVRAPSSHLQASHHSAGPHAGRLQQLQPDPVSSVIYLQHIARCQCQCRATNGRGANKAFKCPKVDAPGGPNDESALNEWHGRQAIMQRAVAAGQESLRANIVPLDCMHRVWTRDFGDVPVLEMRCDAARAAMQCCMFMRKCCWS